MAVFLLLSSVIFVISLSACADVIHSHYKVTYNRDVGIKPHTDYTYKTDKPMHVYIDDEIFIIPKDFETDLASIPRWYWMILSPQYSAFVYPSIIHDYFYRCANLKDRAFADEVFYKALRANGVSKYTSLKFYLAVRFFGAHSYSKSLACNGG